jgi:hypothetical protein
MVTIFNEIQKYPFVHGDCLFDSLTFLFHYSQTWLQFWIQCMTHFAQSLQQPINPQIQELIEVISMFFYCMKIMV